MRAAIESAKSGVRERLDGLNEDLIVRSRRLYEIPEVGYEEEAASGWLSDMLDGAGFAVESGIAGLPTALRGQARDPAQPAAALVKDLKQRGMLDDTLVVFGGEFGRTCLLYTSPRPRDRG